MIKVLVVDDDFMVARVHGAFIDRLAGFTLAGSAHSGAEALTAVERLRPDLVLLDIYLPDMSGLEVLRRLRERAAPVDVVAVTAARDVESVRTALRGGVAHYLIKPFTFELMRDRLERYATARHRFAAVGDVAQDDIDRLFGTSRSGRATLPKGFTRPTAELVARELRTCAGDLSATECSERVGLSRVSARRYLEYLVAAGDATVRLRYGQAGRPERRYHWSRSSP